MKRVTLCMAFYRNPSMLLRHYALFATFEPWMREAIDVVVVDDGSPEPQRAFGPSLVASDVHVRVYRMGIDIPWNQDACRNVAVQHAETQWVLLTDMDHMVPRQTWEVVLTQKLDPECAYTFERVNDPALDAYKPHPNSWLMTRALYDRAGGYDERYAGIYGTDGNFRNRLMRFAREFRRLPVPLIRVPREVTPDASTTTYPRKSIADDEKKRRVAAEIAKAPQVLTVRGRFPYTQVFP